MRKRQDVWKLSEWDDTLLWYARAVAEMQKRPLNDPRGWRYQAAVHDYVREADPNKTPSDVLPSDAEQERFWRQCQHSSWFFLPWHRMYLAFFEQIVAATVSQLGGPDGWALPYWNYSDAADPNARRLPPAFRAERLPDGSNNPLRISKRNPGANAGAVIAGTRQVDLENCLEETEFISDPMGGAAGFGGPRTGRKHKGGQDDPIGDLESVPHGSMHMAVGGVGIGGWMSTFHTAGLDPIFWLHHCNIDRIWSVWMRINRNPRNSNPNDAAWLSDIPFYFHDANGEEVRMTCEQVVETTAPPLEYEYEDVGDPLGGPPPSPLETARSTRMSEPRIPEMVGATDEPVTLAGERASTSLPVSRPTGPASARELAAAPRRVFLNVENVISQGVPDSYAVYVNLPSGADPDAHPEHYAGLLPMFGVAEATDPERGHAGNGLRYSLEITKVVRALEAKNDWNPDELRVTFVPERPASARESAPAGSPVQVGRVSLYYR